MPLDTSIYSMIRPQAAAPDPMEQYGKVMSLKNMMGQQDLQGLQMQQARQGIADDLVVRDAYKNSGGDPKALRAALASGGQFKAVQAFDKNQLETDTAQAKLAQTRQEVLAKSLSINRDLLAGVNDPQQAAQWVMAGFNDPVLSPLLQRVGSPQELIARIPQDPQGFQTWKMQNGLGIEKMLEMTAPKVDFKNTGKEMVPVQTNPLAPGFSNAPIGMTTTPGEDMTNQRTISEGVLNRGMTARGQNMTDARARETMEQGKWSSDLERGLQVNSATGETRPIVAGGVPLGQKEKPVSESQGKAQMFGTRAAEAHKILGDLEGDGSRVGLSLKQSMENAPLVGGALGAVGNTFLGKNSQQIDQAQRNFLNAVLRQESGAVIGPSEFESGKKQYFPQVGDSKETIEQKRKNRESVVEGFKISAGKEAGKRIEAVPRPVGSQKADGKIKFLGFE
jgi:hypothetical protein